MGFLIRMGFWFSLVLLLLPFDMGGESDGAARVNPVQTFVAAGEAIGDIAGICERKPEVCETGRQAIHTIGIRARESARIAYEMLDEKIEEPEAALSTGSIAIPTPRPSESVPAR
jgi:hypothetical protein